MVELQVLEWNTSIILVLCFFQSRIRSDLLIHTGRTVPLVKHTPLKTELTSQTECVQNKLRAVENGEAAVLVSFVLSVLEAVKVFGVPPWTDLSYLEEVH